ncbi:cyclin-domain-containing protein [Microdochium trichocladiopsis]|uniref:Cyclin-domain-containing protein n=1 Tax=Microdochium trichocladiopsis TaxID=1682393 RepID=A0A9P8Y5W2_9PEZI|nr:cyclin-domain-containing protein [Microdochium trichocladiopsis]KAH7029625.1 cyclin-domain-containing protein [Microdochium trichocladiopsis]
MSTQIQTATPAASSLSSAGYQAPAPPADKSAPPGRVIIVRDLAHIESLARDDVLSSGNRSGGLADTPLHAIKYEISSMPISDVIEIPLSSSVLAFHGKNVPAITILSYLSRIHKYCPTTYEVFLSLLVYFDRMIERVNRMVMQAEEGRRHSQSQPERSAQTSATLSDAEMPDKDSEDDDETDSDLADDEDEPKTANDTRAGSQPTPSPAPQSSLITYFVVDSFNIHRLIIAGVTCASKFFSDVFYTNSRYAKVGGLPLAELNHLELQFLVLNDFRLSVPVEDLEAYATMLVEFYAREVVGSRSVESADSVE